MGEKFLWGAALERLPKAVRHGYALVVITVGWVLFRSASLELVGHMLTAMAGFAPGGAWSGETAYYLLQFRWELLLAIPAAMPLRDWLRRKQEERKDRLSALALDVGPRVLAFALLGFSVMRLLSSSFRSFLYFQF